MYVRSPYCQSVCNWWQYHFCVEIFRGRNRMRRSKLRMELDAKDFATFTAWSDKDNLLSTCTPRSLSGVVHFMMLLTSRRKTWIGPVNIDFHGKIIALHFSGCGTIKFLSHHSWRSARTLFSAFISKSIASAISILLCRLHTDKFPQSVVILGGRLRRDHNNVGPRTDLCGTHWAIVSVSESHPLILTNCLRFVRKVFNHSQISPLISRSFSFCRNILCHTVSKALVKSTNGIPTKSFLSTASLCLSVRCIKSCSVDFSFL